MLHVVLCDDDDEVLTQYGLRIEQLAQKHGIDCRISRYSSAEQLLFALGEGPLAADLLYLDVQMGGQTGIEAARRLRAAGCRAQIVFLTNAREAVFESFDAAPLQYLLKEEVSPQKFEEVFLHAAKLALRELDGLFSFERGGERMTLPLREIRSFEVRKRIITLRHDGGVVEFYSSMDELEQRLLGRGFVRTHRAFLANVGRIRRLGTEELLLDAGEPVPLGRTYAKSVKEALSRFLASEVAL